MTYYNIVEQAIQESIARGDPERLKNKGQPIDLRNWQRTPEYLRMGHTVLKNAGIKPQEIELKHTIADLKQAIQKLDKVKDRKARTLLVNKLNGLMVTHSLRMERLRRK